jgi:hypothetical protein
MYYDFSFSLITNSSSTVIQQATSAEAVYALLNEFLRCAGIRHKAEELYQVQIVENMERLVEWALDDPEHFGFNYPAGFDDLGWEKQERIVTTMLGELSRQGQLKYVDDGESRSEYLVWLKETGEMTNIGALLNDIFEATEIYG